jgi:hypothetical protein
LSTACSCLSIEPAVATSTTSLATPVGNLLVHYSPMAVLMHVRSCPSQRLPPLPS